MSRAYLIDAVAKGLGSTKAEAARAIDVVAEGINSVAASDRVALPPLGIFAPKHVKARQGRNIQTGETIQIAAKDTIGFKPSKKG